MADQSVTAPFAALIRDTRVALGMTQDQLAREIGCPQQTIEKIETGKTRKSGYFPVIFAKLGLDLGLLAGAPSRSVPPLPAKFLKSSSVKFYIREWREFMGTRIDAAAKAAGLPSNEYEAHETHPINFTLGQVASLAATIGVRGDQFWFPPPKGKPVSPVPSAPAAKKRTSKGAR